MRAALRAFRWGAEAFGVFAGAAFLCALPRAWAHHVGRRLGFCAFFLARRSRRVALENLRLALGLAPDEARAVALESFRCAGAAIADLLRAPRMRRATFARDVAVPARMRVLAEELQGGGRGAVFACAHLGNWELANLAGAYTGLPESTVVVRPPPNPLLARALLAFRARTGQRLVVRSGAVAKCARRVRDGGVCAITVDLPVPPGSGAAAVDFFGIPAFTTLAVGYVAAVTGAAVYLVYLLRTRACRYEYRLVGPLDAPARESRRATALETTRNVTRALEEAIRAEPGAWAWWMKRWRIRPPGAPGRFPSYAIDSRYVESRRD